MKWLLLALAAVTPVFGQMAPQPQATLTRGAAGSLDLDWNGLNGRSYFIQSSEDLVNWKYFQVVELGLGEPLGYGFASDAEKFFVRLKYTDEPTDDPENADFDGDGLSNLAEVTIHHTDPFKADSDGDGLFDGWEVDNGLDPNDDGSINPINGGSGDWDGDGDSNINEALNNTDPKSSVDHSLKVMVIARELSANYAPVDANDFAITTRTRDYWTGGMEWLFNESVGSIPTTKTQTDYLKSIHPFPSYQDLETHHEGSAIAEGMIWWEEPSNRQRTILIQHTRFWAKVGKPLPVSRSIPFMVIKKQSLGYPPVSAVEEEVINLIVPANSTVSDPKDLEAPFLAANGPQEVQISAQPITFTLRHKEKIRNLDGVETPQIVAPGADTVLRDEIVDLVLSVPSGGAGRALTLDIDETCADQKKEILGVRGETQMYDFGTVGAGDVVTSLTTNNSTGETIDGPYPVNIAANSGDTITLRAVFNKEGKFKLRLKSTDSPATIDILSQEITVTERIRKYGIPYPGYPNHNPNKYDEQFVEAEKYWGEFYSYRMDTIDRLKAMAVAESTVGADPTAPIDRPHDVLTVGNPGDGALARIRGNPAQWDRELVDPRRPAADPDYKKLNYPRANVATSREAIKWAVLWLYVKGFSNKADVEKNPNWTFENGNKAPRNILTPQEEPEIIQKPWVGWPEITRRYNGNGVFDATNGRETYEDRVNPALYQGIQWNAAKPKAIWPILANKAPRKERDQ